MKVLVAMSGGVDSTMAAYKLKEEGHEVVGVNFAFTKSLAAMQNFELTEISKKLGIKIIYRDYHLEFREKVIKSFVSDYECGITPNPCAYCNGVMKFAKLLEVMKEENCDMIATGHYANVINLGANAGGANNNFANSRYAIKKSKNQQKDQSYMLYRLNQEQLSHIIFPIGDMDKNEVRRLAKSIGLSVAEKKDSQDVCFVSDITYKEFIKQFEFGNDYREKIAIGKLKEEDILAKPFLKKGEFVDTDGNVLGFHDGITNYTIGQRRGINIAFGERKFVVKIDVEKNQVVLGDNEDLMSDEFEIYDIVFSGISENELLNQNQKKLIAKLRYRHDGTEATLKLGDTLPKLRDTQGKLGDGVAYFLHKKDTNLRFHLHTKVRAITPGQSAVFYDDNDCIMFGGRIQ